MAVVLPPPCRGVIAKRVASEVLLLHDRDQRPGELVRTAARAGVDHQLHRPRRLESLLRVGSSAYGQRKAERGSHHHRSHRRVLPIDQSPVASGSYEKRKESLSDGFNQTFFYIVAQRRPR